MKILDKRSLKLVNAGCVSCRCCLQKDDLGSILIYFDGKIPKHAGVLAGDGIINSKWGGGHLWMHGIWEVPISYGKRFEVYRKPNPELIVEEFVRYKDDFIKNNS